MKGLYNWENNFIKAPAKGKKRPFNPKTGPFKAALLSGPPGIGKTTTAVLVAEEAGRQVLEMNASDTRSKKSLESDLGDVTGSHVLSFGGAGSGKRSGSSSKSVLKRCIIMDEVDGMGAGDRSGMSELIKMIKKSMVPIICICNDRQSQKIKSLAPHCLDLRYRRPVKSQIAKRAIAIGQAEGLEIEYNAAEAVAESCGNDIRQVINCLQMWSNKKHNARNKKASMTYKDYKERDNLVKKDEMLRVSLFDATKMLVEGRRGLSSESTPKDEINHLYKRTDAFFVDYSLMGLMCHQNYLKIVNQKYLKTKTDGDMDAELECLKQMYKGTETMSDFALAEEAVRGNQNWGLLPLCSTLAVKTGFHAGGENGGIFTGFPEFSGWLGKNSSKGKKSRLVQELSHHMNYKISADNTELRLGYIPAIRNHLSNMLITKNDLRISEAIEFMDDYGLDRDDVFENLDEFTMDRTVKKFSDVESKVKAAFTREYNKGIHKSQALVDEQVVTTRKRKASTKDIEPGDEDEDAAEESENEDEEMDIEELKKKFAKKKGRKKADTKTKRGKKAKK
jgi:replication factor C subunit 1